MEQFIDSKSHQAGSHQLPSDRSWGLTIGGVFVGAGVYWHQRWWLSLVLVSLGLILAAFALVFPRRLHRLNAMWMQLGMWLAKFTNPVLLGAVYLVVVTPMSLLLRLFGKRFLKTQLEPDAQTYWINRQQKAIDAKSLERQF